ncbi:8825_t:CDS:1, partial [Racocetra persica]
QPQIQRHQQQELNVVPIPTFSSENQDPIEWLEVIKRIFEANDIQGVRSLAVVGGNLKRMVAIWWDGRRMPNHKSIIG